MHIILTFSMHDKTLSPSLFKQIARRYMDLIGFDCQPYLVYQHIDTVIPHLHVVTTCVQQDGQCIDTSYILYKRSFPAVAHINKEFALHLAEPKPSLDQLENVPPQQLRYGQQETRRNMEHVISYVIKHYSVTNLTEWNAVLSKYRITAIPLHKTSEQTPRGLLYFLLGTDGKTTGTGILGSKLLVKPTYKNLNNLFEACALRIEKRTFPLYRTLRYVFSIANLDCERIIEELFRKGVSCSYSSADKAEYLTPVFIDHIHHCALSLGSKGIREDILQDLKNFSTKLKIPTRSDEISERTLRKKLKTNLKHNL